MLTRQLTLSKHCPVVQNTSEKEDLDELVHYAKRVVESTDNHMTTIVDLLVEMRAILPKLEAKLEQIKVKVECQNENTESNVVYGPDVKRDPKESSDNQKPQKTQSENDVDVSAYLENKPPLITLTVSETLSCSGLGYNAAT